MAYLFIPYHKHPPLNQAFLSTYFKKYPPTPIPKFNRICV